MKEPFTQDYLKSILYYNSYSGYWIWKINRGRTAKKGQYAGTKNKSGYTVIGIDGKYLYAHILAYFYVIGKWPKNEVDHKDNNKTNNIFSNLRDATRLQNAANRQKNKNNKCQYKGVYEDTKRKKYRQKYRAEIAKDNKRYGLGSFNCPTRAALAYDKKALELNGEFAQLNFPFLKEYYFVRKTM